MVFNRSFRFALGACAVMAVGTASADEGMWTFNQFPSAMVGERYGFTPDQSWLENVRLGSVRLARGCSGSFVSPQGLVMTNHHCAHGCIEQLSTRANDRVANGFYAAKLDDEVKCPDVEVDQLTAITDVTARIESALDGKRGHAFAEAYRAETARIAQECSGGDAHTRCDVIDLYHGGQYQLYAYRRFQDVRLVFSPEIAIAFFGGDPDNFEFPRYNLDVAYLRVYEDGKPLSSRHFFASARRDAEPGDLTFVSGNPGSTSRLATLSQLQYQRDVALPRGLFYLAELRGVLTEFGARGPEQAREADPLLHSTENSFKGMKGRFEALVDPALFQSKASEEASLRDKVAGDRALQTRSGRPGAKSRAR